MNFVFLGQNRSLFNLLKTYVCGENDSFSHFDDGLSLLKILILNDSGVDLILLEHDRYKGFADFFFILLSSRNLIIPLVYIGASNSGEHGRIAEWISENEIQYDIQTLHSFLPAFNKISSALEKPDIKSLLEKPPSSDKFNTEEKLLVRKSKLCPVDVLRNQTDLTGPAYYLLKFLYKNRCREVSINEIEDFLNLNGGNEKTRKNVIYAYISRLRKCIDSVPLCKMEILRTRRGFYKLLLR